MNEFSSTLVIKKAFQPQSIRNGDEYRMQQCGCHDGLVRSCRKARYLRQRDAILFQNIVHLSKLPDFCQLIWFRLSPDGQTRPGDGRLRIQAPLEGAVQVSYG